MTVKTTFCTDAFVNEFCKFRAREMMDQWVKALAAQA